MRVASIAGLLLVLASPAPAQAEDPPPPPPEPKRASIGAGYAGSTLEVDVARDGDESLVLDGIGVHGRFDVKGLWSLQFRHLTADADYATGGRLTLDQLNVHVGFRVYESRRKVFRADGCLGLTWVDLVERSPAVGLFSDRELGPALGIGFEYGPPRWAFFMDFAATFVDIRLSPGVRETLTIGNTITGVTYRFGERR